MSQITIADIQKLLKGYSPNQSQELATEGLIKSLNEISLSAKPANQQLFALGAGIRIPIEDNYKVCYEGTLEESFGKIFISLVECANALGFNFEHAVVSLLQFKLKDL